MQNLSAYARRVWTATDESGNKSSCTQYIYFVRKHVADVLLPGDVTVSCTNPVTDPSATGTPYVEDHGLKINLWPDNTFCEMQTAFTDQVLPVCDGSYKILRTWTILDWCSPTTPVPPLTNPLYHIQVIKVLDEQGPTFSCPANLTVSTDAFTCCATTELPDVIVEDACSRVNNVTARIVVRNPVTNVIMATHDVDAALTTFPE